MKNAAIAVIVTLSASAIIASAKAIVDVAVLKAENKTVKELLIDAKDERRIIRNDIKNIIEKL